MIPADGIGREVLPVREAWRDVTFNSNSACSESAAGCTPRWMASMRTLKEFWTETRLGVVAFCY